MGASKSNDLKPNEENYIGDNPPYVEIDVEAKPIETSSSGEEVHPPIVDVEAMPKARMQTKMQLPHNYEAILKDAESAPDMSSLDMLLAQLKYEGVFLNQKRKKYWVDEFFNKNCFMLFARDLQIFEGEDPHYWKWSRQKEAICVDDLIEAAELIEVEKLEIRGNFDTVNLSPETLYEVMLVAMFTAEEVNKWESTRVYKALWLSNGRFENMHKGGYTRIRSRQEWMEIFVGEFISSPPNVGGILHLLIFCREHVVNLKGLIVKGFSIKPKISFDGEEEDLEI